VTVYHKTKQKPTLCFSPNWVADLFIIYLSVFIVFIVLYCIYIYVFMYLFIYKFESPQLQHDVDETCEEKFGYINS